MSNTVSISTDITEEFIGQAPFSVMARVAMQLGRESISSSIIAITELVKNAYDADAQSIHICFRGLTGLEDNFENSDNGETTTAVENDKPLDVSPVLIIEDDGTGMTKKQLKEQWLVIGTTNKLISGRSKKKGRVLTGEKGLGRLGLDRLCTMTIVQSSVVEKSKATKLVVDWTKYEATDQRLEKIQHDLYITPKIFTDPYTGKTKKFDHGTSLVLLGLKDIWTTASLQQLREELTLLVSPFAGIGDFSISLETELDAEGLNGPIGSEFILDAAEWELIAEIDAEGLVKFQMFSKQYPETFEFGPEVWSNVFKGTRKTKAECGPLTFQMYFYPRQSVSIADLTFSRVQIASFLDANNGIRIYRDGFRVKPYGAPDGTGDWLRLSYRRQQNPQGVTQEPVGSWKVGYNQVVGSVSISRETNANLIDQTNRENLVEGPAFSDMRMFVERAIQHFEINRQKFEIAKKSAEQSNYDKAKETIELKSSETEESVNQAKDIVANIVQQTDAGNRPSAELVDSLTETIGQIESQLQEQRKAQKELEEQAYEREALFQRQKDTLGNLASLGILATRFGHETLGSSNLVLTNAKDLQNDMTQGLFMVTPDMRQDIEEELEIIVHESSKIETFSQFMLRNVRRDKRHRQATNLKTLIERTFQSFDTLLKEKDISVTFEIPETVSTILAFEIDWESIFVNLLANSVWALDDVSHKDRFIRIRMWEKEQQLKISFADSGIGVEAGTEEQIFLPTVSTRRNKTTGEVIGTGMGLSIVQDFVEAHEGGEITVESPCDLGGAQFHITVRLPQLHLRGNRESNNV
ncbi:MAG: sensor histidine kinase [Chloroflexota bacterium]